MSNSKSAKAQAVAGESGDQTAEGSTATRKRREPKPSLAAELPDAEPPEKFSGLAREYIGLSIAGGLVVGVLIGALFPRAAAKKLASRSSKIATVAGELGMAYAAQALSKAGEAARDGREKAIDMGEVIAEKSAEARDKAGKLIEEGSGKARVTGALLARKAAEIVARARS
ncbi:MAG: hypothetical protein KGM17_01995 [Sphingomonadales bacterium]|nr:hypothetical protein [Sphingomonadales bacterium]